MFCASTLYFYVHTVKTKSLRMTDSISLSSGSKANLRSSTAVLSVKSISKLQELEQIITNNVTENKPLVFLHPESDRDEYDEDEVEALNLRDFQTRIFMSSLSINMNSLWLRNHHSDNFKSKSNFTYIRDYFKAAFVTKNHTAAKATLTSELTKWFDLEHHEYCTYATTLASALSNEATNTSFQIHGAMVKSSNDVRLARRTLLLLMDILFSKVYTKTFLHKEHNSNIYRLVHCDTRNTNSYSSLYYAIFSFLLQVALTAFVVLELFNPKVTMEGTSFVQQEAMIVLASLGGIYR